jgi:threonyl-tRNA synthetase
VYSFFEENNIVGYLDHRDEKIGRKIRDAEMKKVPYMIIIGEKEEGEQKISVRKHGEGDLGTLTIQEFKDIFEKEVNTAIKV